MLLLMHHIFETVPNEDEDLPGFSLFRYRAWGLNSALI